MTRSEKTFKNTLVGVGAGLQELRIKKGFSTAKSFTEKYNLPEIQYWRMENGKANITLKSLYKILNIHGVSLQDFFCMVMDQKIAA
ncbi:MAG TPA: helix-turn-helix transcriptional regulator [Chryseosolibacter sp.]